MFECCVDCLNEEVIALEADDGEEKIGIGEVGGQSYIGIWCPGPGIEKTKVEACVPECLLHCLAQTGIHDLPSQPANKQRGMESHEEEGTTSYPNGDGVFRPSRQGAWVGHFEKWRRCQFGLHEPLLPGL